MTPPADDGEGDRLTENGPPSNRNRWLLRQNYRHPKTGPRPMANDPVKTSRAAMTTMVQVPVRWLWPMKATAKDTDATPIPAVPTNSSGRRPTRLISRMATTVIPTLTSSLATLARSDAMDDGVDPGDLLEHGEEDPDGERPPHGRVEELSVVGFAFG